MKTIIAGSRDFPKKLFDLEFSVYLDQMENDITEVVSGGAKGPDTFGIGWARRNGIPHIVFPAQWDLYGKSAGYRRNHEMAEYADSLVAFWDGQSKGTKHMIDLARSKGLLVKIVHQFG